MLPAGARCGCPVAQAFLNGQICAVETRADAKQDRRQAREENQHGADSGIDMNVFAKGNRVGEVVAENAQRSPGSGESGGPAGEAHQQALSQELPDEARLRRAQCTADRQFAAAGISAGQHQAGEIRAGDQPHHGDSGIERVEAGADIVGGHVAQRLRPHGLSRFIGILMEQLRMDGGDLLLRLPDGDAGSQPGHGRQRRVAPILKRRIVGQRRVNFIAGGLGKFETGRHHADHGVRLAVDGHRASDDGSVGMKDLVPHGVAQDHDLGATLFRILGKKAAADGGLRSEDVE
jgi:hypothetical protein